MVSVLPPIADRAVLVRTRLAWHTLAEHVVAPARYRAEGRIGLRATPGGFGTPVFGDAEQVRVDGRELVLTRGDTTTREPITTVAAAAALVGVEPGAVAELYEPTTPLDLDALLVIDDTAAAQLAVWFAFGADVVEEVRTGASPDDSPSLVQLWPEHFDIGLEIGDEARGARGDVGASPGDRPHPEPYLYLTHWSDAAPDPYWNDDAFLGASLPYAALVGADDSRQAARSFFRRGRELLSG